MDTRAERSRRDVSLTPLLSIAFKTSKQLRAILGLRLAEIGIRVGQDHLLAVLEPGRSIHVGALANSLGVRPSTVSKMVDRMVVFGWVQRESDADDVRKTFVALTPVGGHVRCQVLEIWSTIDAELRASLPDADEVERQVRAVDDRLTSVLSRLR